VGDQKRLVAEYRYYVGPRRALSCHPNLALTVSTEACLGSFVVAAPL